MFNFKNAGVENGLHGKEAYLIIRKLNIQTYIRNEFYDDPAMNRDTRKNITSMLYIVVH